MNVRKYIKSDGLTWGVISRNERSITLDGRHFFATRCEPSALWTVLELDLPEPGGQEIGRYNCAAETAELSEAVSMIVKHPGLRPYQLQAALALHKLAMQRASLLKPGAGKGR